jgi:hypothetical protein
MTVARVKSWGPSSVEGTSEEADGGRPFIFSMAAGVPSSLETAAKLESGGVETPAPVVRIKADCTGEVPSTTAQAMDLRAVDDMGRTGGVARAALATQECEKNAACDDPTVVN